MFGSVEPLSLLPASMTGPVRMPPSMSTSLGIETRYDTEERFESIYFSGSLMIMPDPAAALRHCRFVMPI